MIKATPLAGLDVHVGQTHAGVLDQATGELHRRRLKGEPIRVVLAFLEQLGPGVRPSMRPRRPASDWRVRAVRGDSISESVHQG